MVIIAKTWIVYSKSITEYRSVTLSRKRHDNGPDCERWRGQTAVTSVKTYFHRILQRRHTILCLPCIPWFSCDIHAYMSAHSMHKPTNNWFQLGAVIRAIASKHTARFRFHYFTCSLGKPLQDDRSGHLHSYAMEVPSTSTHSFPEWQVNSSQDAAVCGWMSKME